MCAQRLFDAISKPSRCTWVCDYVRTATTVLHRTGTRRREHKCSLRLAPTPNHNVEQFSSEGVIYTEGAQDAIVHCAIRGITYRVRLPSMGD